MNKTTTYWPGKIEVNHDNYGTLEFVPVMGFFTNRSDAEARCSPEAPLVGVNAVHLCKPDSFPEKGQGIYDTIMKYANCEITEDQPLTVVRRWRIEKGGKYGFVTRYQDEYYHAFQQETGEGYRSLRSWGMFFRWEDAVNEVVKHLG